MTDDLRRENAELRATIEQVREERETLWYALTQILHVQLRDLDEWDTAQRILDAGVKGFDEAYGYPDVPDCYRVVSTVEELDALPVGALVQDEDRDYWQKHTDDPETLGAWRHWRGAVSSSVMVFHLSGSSRITVCYLPSDTEGADS